MRRLLPHIDLTVHSDGDRNDVVAVVRGGVVVINVGGNDVGANDVDDDVELVDVVEHDLTVEDAWKAGISPASGSDARNRRLVHRRAVCEAANGGSAAEETKPTKRRRKVKHRSRRTDWDGADVDTADKRQCFVYILQNSQQAVYTGSSHDPRARLEQHNAGRTPSTRAGRPWRLAVTVGPFGNSTAASRFESVVKRGGAGIESKVRVAERALRESNAGADVHLSRL